MLFQTIIKPAVLSQHLNNPNFRIIDVRSYLDDFSRGKMEFQEAHIPNAIHADLEADLSGLVISGQTSRHPLPSPKDLEEKFSGWGIGPDTQVILYDQSHGGIAARLWWMLQWMGHRACAVLEGGWKIWKELPLPVSNKVNQPERTQFVGQPQLKWLISAEEVEARLHDPQKTLIDSRASERYHAIYEPIDPIAGHIPSAKNRPFLNNLDEELGWKDPNLLKAEWASIIGDSRPQDLIIYCGSGVTACHNILSLLYAGYDWPKLYAGSWSEWITNSSRPIQR